MSGRCSLAPCGEDAPASDALIKIEEIDQGLVSSTEMSSFDGYLALSIGDEDLDGDLFRPFKFYIEPERTAFVLKLSQCRLRRPCFHQK